MAAAAWVFPNIPLLGDFSASGLLGATNTQYRLVLVTNAYVPNNATDTNYANVSAAELPTGGGYTAGGGVLTGVVLNQAGGVVKFTCAPFVWSATGPGIPAWRRAVLYWLGTLNGVTNPMIGHFLGDGTNIDVPATTAGNTLTVTPNANGIASALQV